MNAGIITEDVISSLERRFGKVRQLGRGRVFTFGDVLTCSINYSKLLGGHKYFYAIPQIILNASSSRPQTQLGDFVLLICGSSEKILVLPQGLVMEMMKDVTTRRVDVFLESGAYILQTTKHPKLNVTDFLNNFPAPKKVTPEQETTVAEKTAADRLHVKMQWALITLGQAEGCSVWVPTSDRNLGWKKRAFSDHTIDRLPNFGFEENTRRIVQNIDALWLAKNVIRKAFEIESTTSIYSGLLRLNDLVLAQPNNQIDLYIAASAARRGKVRDQLIRPTFHPLLTTCRFLSFEVIEEQMKRVESIPIEAGARISGLIQGERFTLPEHFVYPSGL